MRNILLPELAQRIVGDRVAVVWSGRGGHARGHARAHGGPCTVFAVSKSLLEEVLSMDPDAAVQFLNLLCRLLCRRLRAMNERLVAWRVMGSHM